MVSLRPCIVTSLTIRPGTHKFLTPCLAGFCRFRATEAALNQSDVFSSCMWLHIRS